MTTPLKVLLVEDHDDSRELTRRLLTLSGHSVTSFTCGRDVLQADCSSFDVALIDIGLPEMAGDDLLKQLLRCREMKAIAITGWCGQKDIERYMAAGFEKCLAKPFTLDDLVSAIGEVVGR